MRVSKFLLAEIAGRLGVPGMAGTVLALLALVFYFAAVMPAQNALQRARTQAQQIAEHKQRGVAGQEQRPATPAERLKAFYGAFPAQLAAAESLQKVYDAAGKNNLTLPRGEYALAVDAKANLAKYRVTLPVQGSYEQIRGFIAAALEAVPTLALDTVDFQRQRAGEPMVEAKVRMTLFLARG